MDITFTRISADFSTVSVSYTHLAAPDFEEAALFPCFATGTPPAAITREAVVDQAMTAWNVNNVLHSLVTVSYTHLDVYKRQMRGFFGFGGV